ncbi:MAG: hypothetical protein AAGB51_06110 [Planctomycetota bacterium]
MTASLTAAGRLSTPITPGTNYAPGLVDGDGSLTGAFWDSFWVRLPVQLGNYHILHAVAEVNGASVNFGNSILLRGDADGRLVAGYRNGAGSWNELATSGALSVGWHLITRQIEPSGPGTLNMRLWLDEATTPLELLGFNASRVFTPMNTLWLGGLGNPPGDGAPMDQSELVHGSGDPSNFHGHRWSGGPGGTPETASAYNFTFDFLASLASLVPLNRQTPAGATADISITDPELDDTQGLLGDWTIGGSSGDAQWTSDPDPPQAGALSETGQVPGDGQPRFLVSGDPGYIQDGGGIVIEFELPTNDWTGPFVVSQNLVDAHPHRGYGRPGVLVGAPSATGRRLRVPIYFDRVLYAGGAVGLETIPDEMLEMSFPLGLVRDSNGNTTSPLSGWFVDMTGAAAGRPATANAASVGRTAITFSPARPVTHLATGRAHIAGPITVSSSHPPKDQFDHSGAPYDVHGIMLSPVRGNPTGGGNSQGSHGLDQRDDVIGFGDAYDPALNIAEPFAASPGDSIVKAISTQDPIGDGSSDFFFFDGFGYYIVGDAQPANPGRTYSPIIGFSAGGGARPAHEVDVSTRLTELKSAIDAHGGSGGAFPLAPVSELESVGDALRRWGQPWFAAALAKDTIARYLASVSFTAAGTPPNLDLDRAADGYGAEVARTKADAAIHLLGDVATDAEREELLAWFIQHGCDIYQAVLAEGVPVLTSGGHDQGRLLPIALYLWATDQTAAMATLLDDVGFNELAHVFVWDAARLAGIAPHSTPSSPSYEGFNLWLSAFQEVASVAGDVITTVAPSTHRVFTTTIYRGVVINHTKGQTVSHIQAHNRDSNVITMEPGHDIEVGDSITFGLGFTPQAGDPGWCDTAFTEPARVGPPDATYQGLVRTLMDVVFLKMLGLDTLIQNADAFTAYNVAAFGGVEPVPTDPYPSTEEHTASRTFNEAYLAGVLAAAGGGDPPPPPPPPPTPTVPPTATQIGALGMNPFIRTPTIGPLISGAATPVALPDSFADGNALARWFREPGRGQAVVIGTQEGPVAGSSFSIYRADGAGGADHDATWQLWGFREEAGGVSALVPELLASGTASFSSGGAAVASGLQAEGDNPQWASAITIATQTGRLEKRTGLAADVLNPGDKCELITRRLGPYLAQALLVGGPESYAVQGGAWGPSA